VQNSFPKFPGTSCCIHAFPEKADPVLLQTGKRAGKAPVFKPGFLIKFLQQYLLQIF
jgi:hypothetical protein